jgi:hypothetical protein
LADGEFKFESYRIAVKVKGQVQSSGAYRRVYDGKELTRKELFGSWDSSFNNLYWFKAEVKRCSPGSFVVIDHHKILEQIRFNRLFFAMKPCIDGFLNGCRPYLAVDSTFLTGRFRGQLACAVAVDGHIGCIRLLLECLTLKQLKIGNGFWRDLEMQLEYHKG